MNEMKITGFMHNRARMLVGMFWTKYLLINPFNIKYGSQTGFSKLLVDAIGSTQNKMNHHWITELDYPGRKYSSKGVPLTGRPMNINNDQIKKFDKECKYIKKWLPQLKDIPNKDLYKWDNKISNKYNNIHPKPMFNSKERYEEWINICKITK
jgi:deoxyribodipyrimidine photo-lyase